MPRVVHKQKESLLQWWQNLPERSVVLIYKPNHNPILTNDESSHLYTILAYYFLLLCRNVWRFSWLSSIGKNPTDVTAFHSTIYMPSQVFFAAFTLANMCSNLNILWKVTSTFLRQPCHLTCILQFILRHVTFKSLF